LCARVRQNDDVQGSSQQTPAMDITPNSPSICSSYAIAAYSALRARATPCVDHASTGSDVVSTRTSVDRVDVSSPVRAAMRERVDRIVAAKVEVAPFTELATRPAAADPNVLPMYRHPADKNAAAVRLQGNVLDVQG
jgi:hypothetical protein